MSNDYLEYRGRCKELSEQAVAADPSLRLVRGYYHCPIWGKQAHWWTAREDGTINDPSARQFPSKGCGEYEEFDGMIECEQCGKKVPEDKAHYYGNYAFCSETCICRCVGIA